MKLYAVRNYHQAAWLAAVHISWKEEILTFNKCYVCQEKRRVRKTCHYCGGLGHSKDPGHFSPALAMGYTTWIQEGGETLEPGQYVEFIQDA